MLWNRYANEKFSFYQAENKRKENKSSIKFISIWICFPFKCKANRIERSNREKKAKRNVARISISISIPSMDFVQQRQKKSGANARVMWLNSSPRINIKTNYSRTRVNEEKEPSNFPWTESPFTFSGLPLSCGIFIFMFNLLYLCGFGTYFPFLLRCYKSSVASIKKSGQRCTLWKHLIESSANTN